MSPCPLSLFLLAFPSSPLLKPIFLSLWCGHGCHRWSGEESTRLPLFCLSRVSPYSPPWLKGARPVCSLYRLCMACSCLVNFPMGIRVCSPFSSSLLTTCQSSPQLHALPSLSIFVSTLFHSPLILHILWGWVWMFLFFFFSFFIFFFFSEGGGRQGRDNPLVSFEGFYFFFNFLVGCFYFHLVFHFVRRMLSVKWILILPVGFPHLCPFPCPFSSAFSLGFW